MLTQLYDPTASLSELTIGDPAQYGARLRLIADNPELGDRMNRRLQRIAEVLEEVLVARGADPETAVQAARIASGASGPPCGWRARTRRRCCRRRAGRSTGC